MNTFDMSILKAFNGLAGKHPVLDGLMLGLSLIAEGAAVWVLFGLVLLLVGRRRPGFGLLGAAMLGGTGVAALAANVLKHFTQRPRPFVALGWVHLLGRAPSATSLPSAHAAFSFGAAVALLVGLRALRRRGVAAMPVWTGWAGVGLAALVAVSRVYLGVHYPTDVTAGALLGSALGWGAWAVTERLALAAEVNAHADVAD